MGTLAVLVGQLVIGNLVEPAGMFESFLLPRRGILGGNCSGRVGAACRNVFKDILEHAVPTTLQDVVIIFVTVSGHKKGHLVQTVFRINASELTTLMTVVWPNPSVRDEALCILATSWNFARAC